MKIILLKDIKNIGKKFEIKEVSPGFARNFLFPKGSAMIADSESIKRLETKKQSKLEETKKTEEENKKIMQEISKKEVKIETKVGNEGQLFESINEQKISDRLKEMGFNIEKNKIILSEPIKHQGTYKAKIIFGEKLETEIKIII